MSNTIRAWAAQAAKSSLQPYEYEAGALAPNEVEIAVEHCGICHSDLSMLDNDWGITRYPFVPGHEVVGRIVAAGSAVPAGRMAGQRVGLGWNASSCMHCRSCVAGEQHLCGSAQGTIVGHHGGFAERVRAHWMWTFPIPDTLDPGAVGPLLCGGITVFAPLLLYRILPTARVGVIGIGGLGHMALKFLRAWGCEVTAFSSNLSKKDQAMAMGAHRVLATRDTDTLRAHAGYFDLILNTVNVSLDWRAIVATLAPKGRLHHLGAVLDPQPVEAMSLIGAQREISGSPTGSPDAISRMLEFSARHQIAPTVEHFPMSQANEALEHLRAGKARYRIVLDADFH